MSNIPKILAALVLSFGLTCIVAGGWILSFVEDSRLFGKFGYDLLGSGILATFFGVIGWLGAGYRQQNNETRDSDVRHAFLSLSLLRKVVVIIAFLIAVVAGLGFLIGLARGAVQLPAAGLAFGAIMMIWLAWPPLIANIRNTDRRSLIRFYLTVGATIGATIVVIAVSVYESPEEKEKRIHLSAMRAGAFSSYRYYDENGKKESRISRNLDDQLNGYAEWWHDNGERWAVEFYAGGSPHGLFVHWHSNGKKAWEANYVEGVLQGTAQAWNVDGNATSAEGIEPRTLDHLRLEREEEAKREFARRNGSSYTSYYRSGQKRKEEYFSESGELSGMITSWYFDGKLMAQEPYVEGKIVGLRKMYHTNGNLKSQQIFEDGWSTRVETTWYQNGQKQREVDEANGEPYDIGWAEDGKPLGSCHPNVVPCNQMRAAEDE